MPNENLPDSDFVASLRTNISGIYFRQVAHYTPSGIEREFRNAVMAPALVDDEEFMANLLFLVRKKDVRGLRSDVWQLVNASRLKPAAQVSGWKTVFALGGDGERSAVDAKVAAALVELVQSGKPPEDSPYAAAADRIGGPQTLVALRRLHAEAAARQRVAGQEAPGNHALIGRLDKVRARLERQLAVLTRKQDIAARPQPERTAGLARLYLRRPAGLSCWARRELLDRATPDSCDIVRTVVSREIPAFLPAAGLSPEDRAKAELDLRLRGIALLQKMGAPLAPGETALLSENYQMIKAREPFFYPACDWEDVLDGI